MSSPLYGEGEVAENLLAGAEYNGEYFGVPTELSAYACYANDDLWAEAGLDPATDFPSTWEELVDVAEQLTVRDDSGAIIQGGFDFNWSAAIYMMLHFNPMVQQLGGNMVDEDRVHGAGEYPGSPAGVELLERLGQHVQSRWSTIRGVA